MKTSSKPTLSVIIITKNEASFIEDCLKSVAWADEIIVVDSGSTDNTTNIAKKMGAKVSIFADWQGFGIQKNRALALATKDWVLSIDADERIGSDLKAEIQEATHQEGRETAFELPRLSSYCGQFIHHSGWCPDYVLRLFPRNQATFSNDLVHERVLFNGKVKQLKHSITHLSYEDLDEVLDKVNRYSTAGAQMLFEKGKTSSLTKAILHGLWAFIRTYLVKRGFLDGRMGFILAVSNAETTYYRYLKLMLLTKD